LQVVGKANKRRQKRRQQHQAAQEARGRASRRREEELLAETVVALRSFTDAAMDPALSAAEAIGDLLKEVDRSAFLGDVLASDELMSSLAEDVAEEAGKERAVELATALEPALGDYVGASLLALALAEAGGARDLALRIAVAALARSESDEDEGMARQMAAEVADLRWRDGSCVEAISELDVWCTRWPEDLDLMELRASLLARAAARESGDVEVARIFADSIPETERPGLTKALARFGDRSLLYRMREGVESYISADPELSSRRAAHVRDFMEDIREGAELGPFDEQDAAVAGLALERFWLESGWEDDEDDTPSVLERYAGDASTAREEAAVAEGWNRHVVYGLWLADWEWALDRHGLWVTDIVTRRRIYASFAPEQLESVARWSILVGSLAPIAGVWQSGQSLLELSPMLADAVGETVLYFTGELAIHLAREYGIRPPRRRSDRRRRPRPLGVLADLLDPMDIAEADLTAKVLGSSLDQVVAMATSDGQRTPTLANTDGEPLELINAVFPVSDPDAVRRGLLLDPDFKEDDSDAEGNANFVWLGNEMSPMQAATSLAQFQEEARKRGWGEIEAPDGPRRWIRGTLHFEAGIRVEVNSRARFDALSAVLRRLGAGAPLHSRQLDPAMDLPWSGPLRKGQSHGHEVDAAWMEEWVDEAVPALDGSTPRKAANDPRKIVLLERLLREFEHDADKAAARGDVPLDCDNLRTRLGMRDGVLGSLEADIGADAP
jgi:hypothetical protein